MNSICCFQAFTFRKNKTIWFGLTPDIPKICSRRTNKKGIDVEPVSHVKTGAEIEKPDE
ncbi:MAG: hypothetical protein FD123_374 [Bacteroidetes bacterium]|nr:MAG: hypothetical protein FD123_374 [Bacteroidota bacterium]